MRLISVQADWQFFQILQDSSSARDGLSMGIVGIVGIVVKDAGCNTSTAYGERSCDLMSLSGTCSPLLR